MIHAIKAKSRFKRVVFGVQLTTAMGRLAEFKHEINWNGKKHKRYGFLAQGHPTPAKANGASKRPTKQLERSAREEEMNL